MDNHIVTAKPRVKPRAKYEDCRAPSTALRTGALAMTKEAFTPLDISKTKLNLHSGYCLTRQTHLNSRRYLTGFTLVEMLTVVAIVAVLAVIGVPAVRSLLDSFHYEGCTRAMINSALSTARSIAEKEQTYAGIRFQKAYTAGDTELLNSPQYMIFIIHDMNATNLAMGFKALEGMETIKLPDNVGVTDLKVRTNSNAAKDDDTPISDSLISNAAGLRNATTFSIIFSPSGKLIINDVRVRNRNGSTDNSSHDDIFNTQTNVENYGIGMFYQDDDTTLGLGQELSRNSFIIYDTSILKNTDKTKRWDYLSTLPIVYINPYMGTLINK